jgi:CHASE2 domain-containing sensor protein
MTRAVGRVVLYGSVSAVILALLTFRVLAGHRADAAIRTGFLLLAVVLFLLGLARRWRGEAEPPADPGLLLQMGLAYVGLLFLSLAVLLRPASLWLEALTILALLVLAAAYVAVYRRERSRNQEPQQPMTPRLGLPADVEATYWRVMRGEPVTPEERARLDRRVRRKPGWRNLFRR